MEKVFFVMGAVFMFIGVGAGAFGAHGLSGYFERFPDLEGTFETAVRYHLIHGLAIFIATWAAGKWPGTFVNLSGYLFAAGILLFSGSLYLLVLTNTRWLGAITPLGGVAFLGGWLLLAIAAVRG